MAARAGSTSWIPFWLLLVAVLFSFGLKVVLPRGDGSMSLNFPFILLAIVQVSPFQALLLAALSVAAQCRIRVRKVLTLVQISFNVANAVIATAAADLTLRDQIKSNVEEGMEKTQREFLLRQQLAAIRKELGEGDSGEGADDYRTRLEALQVSDGALLLTTNACPRRARASG